MKKIHTGVGGEAVWGRGGIHERKRTTDIGPSPCTSHCHCNHLGSQRSQGQKPQQSWRAVTWSFRNEFLGVLGFLGLKKKKKNLPRRTPGPAAPGAPVRRALSRPGPRGETVTLTPNVSPRLVPTSPLLGAVGPVGAGAGVGAAVPVQWRHWGTRPGLGPRRDQIIVPICCCAAARIGPAGCQSVGSCLPLWLIVIVNTYVKK